MVTLPAVHTSSCDHAEVAVISIPPQVKDQPLPRTESDATVHVVDLRGETAGAEHCEGEDSIAHAGMARGGELGRPLKNVAASPLLMRSTPQILIDS